MTSGLDYAIVVPSRRRAHNMPILLQVMPSAIICVEDSEESSYAPFVPKRQLLPHPPLDGKAQGVYNWILETIDNEIVIRMDDDFKQVYSNVGTQRRIRDPDEILAILENAARACKDLGLSVFCFSRTCNTAVVRPNEKPIVPVQLAAGVFGVMNAARHRKMDLAMHSRADLDFSMQTLLSDRCLYADIRFYFDFGAAGAGAGGGVGLTTTTEMDGATRYLRKKWGRYVTEPRDRPGKRTTKNMRPVKFKPNMRTNPRAHR